MGMGALQRKWRLLVRADPHSGRKSRSFWDSGGPLLLSVYCLYFTFTRGYLGLLVHSCPRNNSRAKLLLCLAGLLFVWEGHLPNDVRERVFMTYQEGQD